MKSEMKPNKKTGAEETATDKILWRIYYGDMSTFDSSMGSPADAPSTGIVCIVQEHTSNKEAGFVVTAFKDFYYREKEEWWGSDEVGFWQYMFESGAKVVKFGVSIPSEDFQKIMVQASKDTDFGIRNKTLLDYDKDTGWSSENTSS